MGRSVIKVDIQLKNGGKIKIMVTENARNI